MFWAAACAIAAAYRVPNMTANIHPWAGKGIGVNPTGSDYPFVAPSDDIAGLLADLWLQYERVETTGPLRIAEITGLSAAFLAELPAVQQTDVISHDVDVIIRDSNDTLVMDTRFAAYYRARNYGPRLRIHEWVYPFLGTLRVVQHTAFPDLASVRTISDDITPENGILQPRCISRLPDRVYRAVVGNTGVEGNIEFAAGYNTKLSVDTDISGYGLRRVNRITIDVEPGEGLGRYDDCPDDTARPAWKKINGQSASGNVQFNLDGCHWIRPSVTYSGVGDARVAVIEPNTLLLGNDCVPCCQCEDFVRVFKSLQREYAVYADLGTRAEIVRDQYHDNRNRWLDQKQCREDNNVHVNVVSYDCTEADVIIGVCNIKPYCLRYVDAVITIRRNIDNVPTVPAPGSYTLSDIIRNDSRGRLDFYDLSANTPHRVHWDFIEQGGAGRLSFHMRLPAPTDDSFTIEVEVTTRIGDPEAAATVSASTGRPTNAGVQVVPYGTAVVHFTVAGCGTDSLSDSLSEGL